MTKAKLDGVYLMVIGCAVFLLLGLALENASPKSMTDFKIPYYSARCLLQHGDPYTQSQVIKIYQQEKGSYPGETWSETISSTRFVYLPTLFLFTLPLATLSFGPAHLIWMAFSLGSIVLGSFLIWNLAADYAPVLSAFLIALMLANSELLVVFGNPAGLAIGLGLIAVWCFVRDRYWLAGTICMALSLLIKPHDLGPVWLYLLLAGGAYRKRAIQSLAFTIVLGLPAVLYVAHFSPHWLRELHDLLAVAAHHGNVNDPGPASSGDHGLAMMTSLQTALSLIKDDPRFYNPVTYLVCAPLLLVWLVRVLRARVSPLLTWLALACIAPLSLLVVYHRQHDALLLLLAVPACAMLSLRASSAGRAAVAVTTAAFLITGNLLWVIVFGIAERMKAQLTGSAANIFLAIVSIPVPLVLLLMTVFYLTLFARGPAEPAIVKAADA